MTTLCTSCGTVLKDDARYCNNCGTLIPSHPLSPQSLSSTSPPGGQHKDSKNSEEIAQPSPPRPARYSVPNEPPSWMNQLVSETRIQGKKLPDELKIDHHEKLPLSSVPQLDFPVPEPIHRSSSPGRELHIKVWEQEEPAVSNIPTEKWLPERMGNEQDIVQAVPMEAENEREDGVEDLPTSPLAASFPDNAIQHNSLDSSAGNVQGSRLDAVERLDTLPLVVPPKVKPVSQPVKEIDRQRGELLQQQGRAIDRPTHQNVPVDTPAYPRLALQPAQPVQRGQERSGIFSLSPIRDLKQTPPPQAFEPPQQRRRRSRKPLAIALVSLLLLAIVAGAGAWIVLFQPFSVPGITQPQQSFKNTQLGFSILYPSGWESQVDQHKATAHFYDSSQTAQVNVVVKSSNGGGVGQNLQQEASQLGMTGQKAIAPLSFAGATWQQMQGSVLLRGASYIETLLVTIHNQRLFTMMLLAPQSTYVEEERLVFSTMRSSFQFIS